MPRQKLPEGWTYVDGYANTAELKNEWPEITCDRDTKTVTIDDGGITCEAQASAVLAVIRNAGLDPVYTLARQLVQMQRDQNKMSGNCAANVFLELWKLNRLVESLEES